ncbi:hypothetical protein CLOP_g751 [Closterium sp. NIES-67]|nr:hypothetical protein CLOP_g751 [Closterium sp. NIES-67]
MAAQTDAPTLLTPHMTPPALSQAVLEALARNDQFHAHVSALAAGGGASEPPDGAGPPSSGRGTSAYLRRLLGLAGGTRGASIASNSSAESSPRALFHDLDARDGPLRAPALAAAAGAEVRAGAGGGGIPILGGVMGRSRKERSVSPIPAASRLSSSATSAAAEASRMKVRQHDPKALAHAALAAVTTGSAGTAGGTTGAKLGARERGDAHRAPSEHLRGAPHGGNRSRVVPLSAALNAGSLGANNSSACAADGGDRSGGAGGTAGGAPAVETPGRGKGPGATAATGAESFSAAGRSAPGASSAGHERTNFSPAAKSRFADAAEVAAGGAGVAGLGATAVPAGTARRSNSAASSISGGNSARVRRSHDRKGISATSSGGSLGGPSLGGEDARTRAAKGSSSGHVAGGDGGSGGGSDAGGGSGGGSGSGSPLTASALARLPGGELKRGSSSRQQKQTRLLQEVEEWLQSASPATPAEAEAAAAAAAAAMAASREGEWRKQEAREAGEGEKSGGKERQGRGSERARERAGGTESGARAKEDGTKGKERERGKERVKERGKEERVGREKEKAREERAGGAVASAQSSMAEHERGSGSENDTSSSKPVRQLKQTAQAALPGQGEEGEAAVGGAGAGAGAGGGGGKNGAAAGGDGGAGGGIWQVVREDGQEHSPVSTLDFSQAARPAAAAAAAGGTGGEGRDGDGDGGGGGGGGGRTSTRAGRSRSGDEKDGAGASGPVIPPVSASLSSVRPSKAGVLPGDVMPRGLPPPPHALAESPSSPGPGHSSPFQQQQHQQHRQHQQHYGEQPPSPSPGKHHHHHHHHQQRHQQHQYYNQQQQQQHQHQQNQQQQRETLPAVLPRSNTDRSLGMGVNACTDMQTGLTMGMCSMGGMGGMGGLGGMGGMDVDGMEQDLDYVRHILMAAGFAGPHLPPHHSQTFPIPPHIFPHLESSIVAAASPRSLPGSAQPPGSTLAAVEHAKRAEERRQRRLLFDAVNEALGRRLGPFVELPVWAEGLREPLVRPRPMGLALLQEVWGEIHDWPVAASEEVYDILDDAARRDMGRGMDRWVDVVEEIVGVVVEVEEVVTMQLIAEVVGEMTDVERQRKARRASPAGSRSSGGGGGAAPATPARRLLRSNSGGGISVQELVGGKNGNPLKGFRWLGRRGL